jgi:cytochrome c oxidase subunit 4
MTTMVHTQDKNSMLGEGIIIFVYLAVLTVLEYFVAVAFNAVPILVVVAVIKAALVVWYYMHIYKLNLESHVESPRTMAIFGLGLIRLRGFDGHAHQPAGFDPTTFKPVPWFDCDRRAADFVILHESRRNHDAQR